MMEQPQPNTDVQALFAEARKALKAATKKGEKKAIILKLAENLEKFLPLQTISRVMQSEFADGEAIHKSTVCAYIPIKYKVPRNVQRGIENQKPKPKLIQDQPQKKVVVPIPVPVQVEAEPQPQFSTSFVVCDVGKYWGQLFMARCRNENVTFTVVDNLVTGVMTS